MPITLIIAISLYVIYIVFTLDRWIAGFFSPDGLPAARREFYRRHPELRHPDPDADDMRDV